MQILTGTAIMDQITAGRLLFYHRPSPEVPQYSLLPREQERARFEQARRQAVQELKVLYDRAARQVGEETAAIFSTHIMLLEDEGLIRSVEDLVTEEGVSAPYAVLTVGKELAAAFSAMDDPYMQARWADIRDISRRVIRTLMDLGPDLRLTEPAILVSNEFLPSEVMESHEKLLGLIFRKGSLDSHTAMLIRAWHIPAFLETGLDEAWDGHLALMDGNEGLLYLDPDQPTLERLRERYQAGGQPACCAV